MSFKPVWLPEDRRLDGKASQTFLRHANGCMRSGYLYALYKGEASTVEMVRGSALHAILERSIATMVDRDESYIPADVVKVIVNEVLAEYPVPMEEHDYVREMAYRWASEFAAEPPDIVAIETLLVLEVDGWQVRMKVDFAQLLEGGAACAVSDWKSSRSMPTQEDVGRKRDDGTLFAKSFQLVLYALGMAYGVPVRVEERDGERVEIPEPFPLAGQAQRFDLSFVYPGIEDKGTGQMAVRTTTLTRNELHEYLESLRGLLRRIDRALETGDWPAQVSDEACGECPARMLCPIPVELRDHRGTINTVEQASEAAEVLDRRRATDAAIAREIKAFCKANGIDLRFGKDKIQEFVPTYAEEIKDREGMFAAMQRAVEFGEPFDRSQWVREKRGTSFKARTLTADELLEERLEQSIEGDG